jgi:hypothetical protein
MEQADQLEANDAAPSSAVQENVISSPAKQPSKKDSPQKETSINTDQISNQESNAQNEKPVTTPVKSPSKIIDSPKAQTETPIEVDEVEKPTEKTAPDQDNTEKESEPKQDAEEISPQEDEKMNVEEKEAEQVVVENTELFKSVRYFVIQSDDSQVEKDLESRGAKKDPYLSTFVSHVICDNVPDSESLEFENYTDAKDIYDLPIVKVNSFLLFCIKKNHFNSKN